MDIMRNILPILTALSGLASAESAFHPPVILTHDQGAASSESPGYASPCLADIDGDGKDELLVGQFSGGNIAVYPIKDLTKKSGQLGALTWVKHEGKRIEVPGVW